MSDLPTWLYEHRSMLWIVAVGALANVACGVVGCYLVLRRMSLLGDAISHAILPGIVGAFVLSGVVGSWPALVGAMIAGMFTAYATETLHGTGNVPEDASMGVVFTSLFALGVFMLSRYADGVHLDGDNALYGSLDFINFHQVHVLGITIPRAAVPLSLALVAVVVFVVALWKELKIVSFDEALATAMGFSARRVHYLLMGVVAMVTVASFEAVGALLVVAMLIVPGATAHLLTDRLKWMLVWSAIIGVLSAVLGHWAALVLNNNSPAMMTVAAGAQFALAVVFAPRHGLLAKSVQQFALSMRIVGEDVMAMLYRGEELAGDAASPQALRARQCVQAVGGGWVAWFALPRLRRRGQIDWRDGHVMLTDQGRLAAQSLVRSHRLWEAYLIKHFHLPLDHVHAPAERIEHYIGPRLQATLADELRGERLDPHGREIPPPASPPQES